MAPYRILLLISREPRSWPTLQPQPLPTPEGAVVMATVGEAPMGEGVPASPKQTPRPPTGDSLQHLLVLQGEEISNFSIESQLTLFLPIKKNSGPKKLKKSPSQKRTQGQL